MYIDHSRALNPQPNKLIQLYAIYRLKADHTYQVNHPALESGKCVFVYTELGKGLLQCSEGNFTLTPGTALLFSADTPFSYRTGFDRWDFWWFEFSGNTLGQAGILYYLQGEDWIGRFCSRALEALREGNSSIAATYFSSVLAYSSESIQRETDARKELFSQIQAFLKENLSRTNVSSLSQAFNLDPRTLYNLFERYADCSPKKYLRLCIVENARYLLANTTKTIGEIADETGFSSPFHFSQVFKEVTGVSPSAYRQQIHANCKSQ